MFQAYALPGVAAPAVHNVLRGVTAQHLYEALVGLRGAEQRRALFASTVPVYRLDRALRTGRVVRVAGDVRGPRAWLSLVVALDDGTHRAVSLTVDQRKPRPITSAVVL